MAVLPLALTTYPTTKDTYSALSDAVDENLAIHPTSNASAIVAVQDELGEGLKGTVADLVARLATCLSGTGAINGGTSFPISPTPVDGQLFWKTDTKEFYIYDGALAQWQRIDSTNVHGSLSGLSADDHAQYLLVDGTREGTGNQDITGNFRFKSGTSFPVTLDHVATVARTITFPDETGSLILAGFGSIVDADINASGITTRSKLPSSLPYEDEANIFTSNQEIQKASPIFELDATTGDGTIRFSVSGTGRGILHYSTSADEFRLLDDDSGDAIRVAFSMADGEMTTGIVPLARMQRTEVSADNASLVTVTSGVITITTIDLGTVSVGDRILVNSHANMTKGGTGGDTGSFVNKDSGTATVSAFDSFTGLATSSDQLASEFKRITIFGMLKVTVAGTLTIKFEMQSAGSDGTVAAGQGQLYGLVLNNG